MAIQFITKKFRKPPKYFFTYNVKKDNDIEVESIKEKEIVKTKKNNKKNNKEDMFDKDKIAEVEAVIKEMQPEVKVVKTDRGLIERTESSKIIITEDNRQVLND
jgi:ribonuclease HI